MKYDIFFFIYYNTKYTGKLLIEQGIILEKD